MTGSVRARGALGLALVLAGVGCAGGRLRAPLARADDGAAQVVGLYRGSFESAGGASRRFRLMLFAARPDRLHGELIGPLGSAQLIVDGGGGRLAVTLVGERRAYVGPAGPQHVARIFGVALELADVVRALLDGVAADSHYSVVRSADPKGTLPAEFELQSDGQRLRIELRQRRALGSPGGSLGTGEPPAGMDRHPIEQLGAEGGPLLLAGTDAP